MVSMGREIKDGKPLPKSGRSADTYRLCAGSFKEHLHAPEKVELFGTGACGKGYKEWVKVSDGGPYLKCKVRLG